MGNVSELAVGRTLAGHSHEHAVVPVNHPNVVNDEFVIDRYGCDRFHTTLGVHAAESHIGNLHLRSPPYHYEKRDLV
jgi:hypothetical protein